MITWSVAISTCPLPFPMLSTSGLSALTVYAYLNRVPTLHDGLLGLGALERELD